MACNTCIHHIQYEIGTPRANAWYNWYCQHPSQRRPIATDPVTGATAYLDKWGGTTDEEYPNCRYVMQSNGYCPLHSEGRIRIFDLRRFLPG